jgi:ComEC/Rec2-related protein
MQHAPSIDASVHRALVCGEALSDPHALELLRSSALIHFVVVSGAHLTFLLLVLDLILQRWHFSRWWALPVLALFTLMCGLQAPLLRNLVSWLLREFSRRYQLAWPPVQIAHFSGCICLILEPRWVQSLGLLLSWTAGVTFSLIAGTRVAALPKQILIWLILAPVLLPLAVPSPLGIACNLVLAPMIGHVLLPLSMLSFVIPPCAQVFSWLWSGLQFILEKLDLANPRPHFEISLVYLWSYLLILQLFLQLAPIWRARFPQVRD